jgi:hypothetical protein
MSFTSIEHSMVAWAEKELGILVKKAPAIEQVIAAGLKYAGPALQTVVTLEAGAPAGAVVGKVIADAQAGLVAASALIYDFGPNPTFGTVLDSTAANLQALLAAGHVTSDTSTKVVTTVVANLQGLSAALAPKAA